MSIFSKNLSPLRLKWALIPVCLPVVLFVLSAPVIHAQVSPIVEPIVLTVTPTFPAPNEVARAQVESYSLNLDKARSIRWFVAGTEISAGESARNIVFRSGNLGENQLVRVVIETEIGTVYSKDVVIRPALIDLVWQADTYTPAFYKGKALASSGSTIRVQAIPQFKSNRGLLYDTNNIVYTWKHGGRTIADSSGRGRDSVRVSGPVLLFGVSIEVTAQSVDGLYNARAEKTIVPADPKVLLYENNPLLGILQNKALSKTYDLAEEEVTIVAEPYYFSSNSRSDPNLSYAWSINGKSVVNPSTDKGSITLRPAENNEGSSNIGVVVQNITKPLQRFAQSLRINFNADRSQQNTF